MIHKTPKDIVEITSKLQKYNDSYYINDIYLLIENSDCYDNSKKLYNFFTANIMLIFYIFSFAILLIVNLLFTNNINYEKKIGFARVKRAKNKLINLYGNIQIIEDNIQSFNFTVFQIGSRLNRFKFIFKNYFRLCINDYLQIKKIVKNEFMKPYVNIVLFWCIKRIPHTVIYLNTIECIISNYKLKTIYTGHTYDRFAIIEYTISQKYNKILVCLPHGIERTDKLPVGFVGDYFLCSSQNMSNTLNILYNTKKYIFNETIIKKIYNINNSYHNENYKLNKVVFFTQPLEVEKIKKIILFISLYLKNERKLYIKVHPREKKQDYNFDNIEFIDDFNDAIFNNLCISFSSTILLEALYNDSVSLSVIHLVLSDSLLSGRYEFLNDSRIIKPNNSQELLDFIENYFESANVN